MSLNFRRFLLGIQVVPKTTSTVDTAGEVDFDTTGNKLNLHNGTSASPVVTEVHASQGTNRLKSKDLEDSSTAIVDASDTTKKIQFDAAGTTGTATTLVSSQTANRSLTLPDATDTIVGRATTDTLTNKTLSGNTATDLISGAGTLTLNTSGTVTVPNATDTLVGKATTDVLTNKTIDGDDNTVQDLPLSSLKTVLADAGKLLARDGAGAVVSTSSLPAGITTGTFHDDGFTIQDGGDTSKQFQFQASGITTATTRTYTVPDISDTLVTKTSTDTGTGRLKNKDLDAVNVKFVDTTDTTKTLTVDLSNASTGVQSTLAALATTSTQYNLIYPGTSSTQIILAAGTQTISGTKEFAQDVRPDADNTRALGTSSRTWTNLLLSGFQDLLGISTPSNPSAGRFRIYPKTDGIVYVLNSSGTETSLVTASGTQTLTNKTLTAPETDYLLLDQQTTPSNPAATKFKVYAKSDGNFYILNSSGVESVFSSSALIRSEVWVQQNNGYGSTNTTIRRFLNTNVNTGTAITYADSATDGASFTINEDGLYSLRFGDQYGGSEWLGISLNSAQLTTAIYAITDTDRIAIAASPGVSTLGTCSVTLKLTAGDVVRPHTGGSASGANTNLPDFRITKVNN